MNSIAKFFTLYWIIYYPTCIAFNNLPGFSSIDEVMTGVLIVYTFMMRRHDSTNPEPWREYFMFLGILAFYVAYSLMMKVNVAGAVWLDFIQQIRPFSIIFCTWILNPRFTEKQKKWMLGAMVLTLGLWIIYHPETLASSRAEFPVLGQLAICTGMAWYLFTEETSQNKYIALALVLTGMLAPKFKFLGEVVCFIAFIFFVKKQLNFRSPKTAIFVVLLMTVVIAFTWQKFDVYYYSGWTNEALARPQTYLTSLRILGDYFPFGSGMGTFAANGAMQYYSPIYHEYGLDQIWGLSPATKFFICDTFYPSLAQYGIVGVVLFCIFWKRRLKAMNEIEDMRYYRIALITFFCLVIEQTADSSWLSGKGMGYCMLLGLCMNANFNADKDEGTSYDNDNLDDDLNDNGEENPTPNLKIAP